MLRYYIQVWKTLKRVNPEEEQRLKKKKRKKKKRRRKKRKKEKKKIHRFVFCFVLKP